jgi:hypothetical protein
MKHHDCADIEKSGTHQDDAVVAYGSRHASSAILTFAAVILHRFPRQMEGPHKNDLADRAAA